MLTSFLEIVISRFWNRWCAGQQRQTHCSGLRLGRRIVEGEVSRESVILPAELRTQHVVIVGRTGSGKSSLIQHSIAADIASDTGFLACDFHADSVPSILSRIAAEESKRRMDLSRRVIVINPADPDYAVGLPILQSTQRTAFVEIAEFAEILKKRWHLDTLGARTEELLRNTLFALSENHLTPIEIAPFLTNAAFRSSCMRQVGNPEVQSYFRDRYDQASDAMQMVLRDPVLNKVTAFTADPHFRHMLGQRSSRFSLLEAIDAGYWILLNLNKALLGEQALTVMSLLLAQLKNRVFARKNRKGFSVYLDEVQNLVASDASLETLLSESRKAGLQICTANQFLEQLPAGTRAALLACGSHVFFRLSSGDAEKMAAALDGGKPLQELLKNLPQRQIVAKLGPERWRHVQVPEVTDSNADATSLYLRSRNHWATRRSDIEADIRGRLGDKANTGSEVLDDWE